MYTLYTLHSSIFKLCKHGKQYKHFKRCKHLIWRCYLISNVIFVSCSKWLQRNLNNKITTKNTFNLSRKLSAVIMACGCHLDLIAMDILNKWLLWALNEEDDEKVKVTCVSARFAPFPEDSSRPHTFLHCPELYICNIAV